MRFSATACTGEWPAHACHYFCSDRNRSRSKLGGYTEAHFARPRKHIDSPCKRIRSIETVPFVSQILACNGKRYVIRRLRPTDASVQHIVCILSTEVTRL